MAAPTLVVNSHVNNEVALARLFESLASCPGVESADVIVAVGGHPGGRYATTAEGAALAARGARVTTVLCPHNSIDFTGLIALLEVPELERDRYFYVHDTCEAGPRFLENLARMEPYDTASFVFHSMNIGQYSRAALEHHRDLIMSFKNEDLSREAAEAAKADCVAREDAVFRAAPGHVFVDRAHVCSPPPRDVYGTGVLRKTRWYPIVDLYKHAANWTGGRDPVLGP